MEMSTYTLLKAERLPDSLGDYLEDLDLDALENLLGGFTSDAKLCWVASDSYLEVMRVKSAETVSRWTFGSVLKVTTSKIVSVDELKSSLNEVIMLAVGLEYLGNAGMVCIFDIYSMKIVRAIQIPEKVTFVHVIYNGNEHTTFPGVLNSFDGALAVGTEHGNVYIVDLCREAVNEARQTTPMPTIKDEVDPCTLIILRPEDLHRIESHKEMADRKGNHLAIHLNALIGEQSPHFMLKGPQGDTKLFVNKEEVFVSSLHFAPQLSSLLVGYNFGALQIWDLISTNLVYTSPVCEENIPISHFAVQEPVDDPRAFCYFWATYSYKEACTDSFPVAALYSLCYESKEWHEGYGYIYQNLQSCSIRFQTDLAVTGKENIKDPIGGQCLRVHSLSNMKNRDLGSSSITELFDDSYKLCLMVWNVWCKDRSSHIFLSIFDLNQWYKEQMPNAPHNEQSKKYMTTVCISDVSYRHCEHKFPAIDVHINPSTISLFKGAQKLEEHYYPTSLAFECLVLSEYEICHLKNFGVQRKFYYNLGEDGPLALLKPSGLYEKSVEIGLTPLFMDPLQVNHTNATHQREHLLSIALENKMRNWLFKCATSWGNGSHRVAGLSLDLMLNWAWNRAKVLKSNADRVCTTLFDYSAIKMDQNGSSILNKCRAQILVIKDLYKYIQTNCSQYLINPELTEKQHKCLERIHAYLDVLGWMYNVGLLPEHRAAQVDRDGALIPYRLANLRKVYEERRSELRLLDGKKQLFGREPVLFIDKFIEMCGSQALEDEWIRAGGGSQYPPSSLQALLRTYLVEDLELKNKHIIVSYLFMDIADSLDPIEYKLTIANLLKFPVIFQFTRSQLKLIQGFWHLDHNQLGSAAELFIDPMLESRDIEQWHHKQILSTFMLQDANKLALLYLTFQKPPINDINDVSTIIAVYVNNKMLHEAFNLQREHSGRSSTLLNVIFREMLRTDQLKDLLTMTLTRREEEELILFLDKASYHERNDFKAVYFSIRGRYLDFRLNVKHDTKRQNEDCFSLSNTCRDILDTMASSDTKKIIDLCLTEKGNLLTNSTAPKPMSTFLFNKTENLKYKSNFAYACVSKAHEIWYDAADRASHFQDKNSKLSADDFPFVRVSNAIPLKHRYNSELIYPKIVTTFLEPEMEEGGPSPVKRMKLSPRQAVHTPQPLKQDPAVKKLLTNFDTPVITASRMQRTINEATPQSILKEHSVQREVSSRLVQLSTPQFAKTNDDSIGSIGKRLTLTPSKRRSVVRFTNVGSANSSASVTKDFLEDVQMDVNPLPNITNTSISHKSSLDVDESTTESFYSPEVSSNADRTLEEERKSATIEKDIRIEENEDSRLSTKHLSITDTSFTKKVSSASVSETSFMKKTSMTVEKRSFVEGTNFTTIRNASPFKASRILEDAAAVEDLDLVKTKDEHKSISETSVLKQVVPERSSFRDLSASLRSRSFGSPVPATLRSRKSYKEDVVKRVTRSSLFTQAEENPQEVIEEKECEETPKPEPKSSKLQASRRYSNQMGRKSLLVPASGNDHIQSPLSRRSYRGENISTQELKKDQQLIEHDSLAKTSTTEDKNTTQHESEDDEEMEVISLSSRTTVDTKNTDEDAAFYQKHIKGAGLGDDSSNPEQDAISIDEDSTDDGRIVNEDVMFAGGPAYSEEGSNSGDKRRIAGKIVFETQGSESDGGDDYDRSKLASTIDDTEDNSLNIAKSRLDLDISSEGSNDVKHKFNDDLPGLDSGDCGVGITNRESTFKDGRNESMVSTRRSLITGRRPQATIFGRSPIVAHQSIISMRKTSFTRVSLNQSTSSKLPESIVTERRSQIIPGFNQSHVNISNKSNSDNDNSSPDSSKCINVDSDSSSDASDKKSGDEKLQNEEQLETISLSSKSESVDSRKPDDGDGKLAESPRPKSPSRSNRRSSLRTSIFKPTCRRSLRSTSPKIEDSLTPSSDCRRILEDEAAFSREKRFTIGLNAGFIQSDVSAESSSHSDKFEKNITEGDVASFSENLKGAGDDNTGGNQDCSLISYETPVDSPGNLFEKNISTDDVGSFLEDSVKENKHAEETMEMDDAIEGNNTVENKTIVVETLEKKLLKESSSGENDAETDKTEININRTLVEETKKSNLPATETQDLERSEEKQVIPEPEVEKISELKEEERDSAIESVHEEVTEVKDQVMKTVVKETNVVQEHLNKSEDQSFSSIMEEVVTEDQINVEAKDNHQPDQTDIFDKTKFPMSSESNNSKCVPLHCKTDCFDITQSSEVNDSVYEDGKDSTIAQNLQKTDIFDKTTTVTPRKIKKRDETALLDSPARRTRSITSSGSSPLPTRTLRSRRSVSTDLPQEEPPKTPTRRRTSFSVKESEIEPSSPATRTRRASTSTEPGVSMAPPTRRNSRAKSVDAALEEPPKVTPRGRGKKSALPAITEDKPALEEYSETRRLTRRQKEMFLKNATGEGDDKNYDINLQSIDPIQLLDKEEFKGKADPDEQQLLQHSPASSVISSSATEIGAINRKDRGHSSDRSVSEIASPKRNLRSSSKVKDDPPVTAAPVRRTRRASKDSVASDASEDVKSGVKKLTTKHTLSHISEDSHEDAPKPKTKRGRPRKN